MGFLDNLKNKIFNKTNSTPYLEGFKKTNDSLGSKLNRLKSYYKELDDEFLEELMIILLEADVGIATSEKICTQLKQKCNLYSSLTFKEVMSFLLETMHEIYIEKPFDQKIHYNSNGPTVILMVGVNGAGKTTTIAKLAQLFKADGKKVAVVAADTFRAGAVEQLSRWAQRLDINCVKGLDEQDPSSVIVEGCRFAKENNIDVLLCDTAGRLQNKVNLMNELSKMYKVIDKEIAGGPHNVWLVIDSTTGQNGLSQAKQFHEATDLSGIILTKMDGTAKGGIVLAIKDTLGIGVMFLGLGETMDDLKSFDLDLYLYSITQGLQDAQ